VRATVPLPGSPPPLSAPLPAPAPPAPPEPALSGDGES
jgi:hypothetical protein